MTSDQIDDEMDQPETTRDIQAYWLAEIAFQLAVMNEGNGCLTGAETK